MRCEVNYSGPGETRLLFEADGHGSGTVVVKTSRERALVLYEHHQMQRFVWVVGDREARAFVMSKKSIAGVYQSEEIELVRPN